jgi:hypothetical protein
VKCPSLMRVNLVELVIYILLVGCVNRIEEGKGVVK